MEFIYQNPSLSPKERTDNLLSLMSLEEKVGQMMQISYNTLTLEEAEDWVVSKNAGSFLHVLGKNAEHLQELALSSRLGIPIIFGIDAIHGHGLMNGSTIFPNDLLIFLPLASSIKSFTSTFLYELLPEIIVDITNNT